MPTGRQYLQTLTPRSVTQAPSILGVSDRDLPSVTELLDRITFAKPIEIYSATPELRFTESDQTDPAGRYRQGVTGDILYMERSDTAKWADDLGAGHVFFQYNVPSKFVDISAPQGDDWYTKISAGLTVGKVAAIKLTASATPTVEIQTGDNAGSLLSRLIFRGGSATADIDLELSALDMNGLVLKGLATMGGEGTGNVNFKAYKAPTDATAYRIGFYVLNPATDTEYAVAQAVPKAATPLWTELWPSYTPTTAEVDAGFGTLVYDGTTVTLWVNKAGAMLSLALGVPA